MNFQPPEEDDPRDDDQRMQDAEKAAPPIHHVHAERSCNQRAKAIIAFNTCTGDLDNKLDAAWRATLQDAKVSRPNALAHTGQAAPAGEVASDPTYDYAVSLARAIFASEYASDPDYASGKIKWDVCDTTAGVLTQIDNMVSGMKRATPAAEPAAPGYVSAPSPVGDKDGDPLIDLILRDMTRDELRAKAAYLMELNANQARTIAENELDAARYRWLKATYTAANFDPASLDLGDKGVVLMFVAPDDMLVSSDLDEMIDEARALDQEGAP